MFTVNGKNIYVIALTGGPCAGKTESLENFKSYFESQGYAVFNVPETSSELICNDISARTVGNDRFQVIQLRQQLAKEASYIEMARDLLEENPQNDSDSQEDVSDEPELKGAIINCDRGAVDGEAFSYGKEFINAMDRVGVTKQQLLNSYDGIVHFMSVAVDAPHLYTRSNNEARTETRPKAVEADKKCNEAYNKHPNRGIFDNSTNLQGKVERSINWISENVLGIEPPFKQYLKINTLEVSESSKGRLVVMTGPSGVGKTTAVKALEGKVDFETPVSYTTRTPREGEIDGIDYHFVDKETFKAIQLSNGFLETAEFNGNMYGTSKDDVEWALKSGHNVLLDLEIQGVKSVKEIFPDSITVFMEAPNDQIWEERLIGRGSETWESLNRRINQGRKDREEYGNIPGETVYITCTTVQDTAEQLGQVIKGDSTFRMKDDIPSKTNVRGRISDFVPAKSNEQVVPEEHTDMLNKINARIDSLYDFLEAELASMYGYHGDLEAAEYEYGQGLSGSADDIAGRQELIAKSEKRIEDIKREINDLEKEKDDILSGGKSEVQSDRFPGNKTVISGLLKQSGMEADALNAKREHTVSKSLDNSLQ